MAEQKKQQARRKPHVRRDRAVHISVWSVNGSPVPDAVLGEVESAVEQAVFRAFNNGVRLLTQTNRG